jgi:diguanylate cyclase (GGDEF)-like protein
LYIAICLYVTALVLQALASLFSLFLFKHSTTIYRWAWLYLAVGLTLMLGRRITPILAIFELGHYSLIDAGLSATISGFLMTGVLGLKKLLLKADNTQLMMEDFIQHDPLTNCLSRPEILYRISQEISRSNRNNHSFALLEIDIDHFKNVNDQYGHQVGDEVLQSLIRQTRAVLRSIDMIGRIGGEEFLILLPETNIDGARQLAERLRAHIADTNQETRSPTPINITISIGIAFFEPTGQSDVAQAIILQDLIQQADGAMYQAKNSGRNKVVLSDKSLAHQR